MQENWKSHFTTLLLSELSRRTSQTLKIASAAFSEEIENKRDTLTESEFLLFVESEPNRIKKSPSWDWFYKLKSKYKTIKRLERFWIEEYTASLSKPPDDISDLVSSIEKNQNHSIFLEGLKLRNKIGLLRSAAPVKSWKKYDPFADALKQAIEDEKLHLGNTPAKIEFVERIAGMLEAQVNWRFNEFFDEVDMRFERLNRENERLLFLEEQRKTLQNNKAIAFFDKKLYHTDNALETRERVEIAIQMEIDPTVELLEIWQNSNPKPEGLIQSIPFLTQMIDGWVEAKKFEFIEQELELREKAINGKEVVEDLPLLQFFEDSEKLDLALRAAFETGLINQDGKWAHIGEKTKAVSIFWRVSVESGLANPSPAYKVIGAIEKQFSHKFGKNAIDQNKPFAEFDNPKSEYPEKYKQLCKDLFAIMRPGKT